MSTFWQYVKRMSFWDILAWICFFWVLLYFSLRAFGIFHIPPLAEFTTVLSAGYFIGKMLTHLQRDVGDLKKDMDMVKKNLTRLNDKVFPFVS